MVFTYFDILISVNAVCYVVNKLINIVAAQVGPLILS